MPSGTAPAPARRFAQKMYNWNTLNSKVFKKMGFQMRQDELDALCNCARAESCEGVTRKITNLAQESGSYPSVSHLRSPVPAP